MTVDPERYKEAVLEMLSVPEDRVSVGKILDPNYWLGLNPHLSNGDETKPASFEATPVPAGELERIRDNAETHSYFRTPPILSLDVTEALRQGIEVLKREHLPPAFCFVYDEAWLIGRLPSLVKVVGAILGEGFKQISRMWCHYVPAVPGSGGWNPHSDGGSHRLTLWIPISEATLDNGCMYVIQKDRVPVGATLATADAATLLGGVRALPARLGEVLG